MYAPFEIDITQPMNHYSFRIDAVYDWQWPDRAETFWARPSSEGGRGPAEVERSVSYQDFRILWEIGSPRFSTQTVIPIRLIDPTDNKNHAGLSDMEVTTKTLLLDGRTWQITQIFRNYFNTGAPSAGLSTGHISMEPGFLVRYKWSERTYFHGELKYFFPIAGHLTHSGQYLRWGLGGSQVWYDSDSFAVIPTVEFIFLSLLNGEKADLFLPPLPVDGECVSNVHLGVRLVSENGGDLGLFELGVAGALDLGSDGWYSGLLRIELRWMY